MLMILDKKYEGTPSYINDGVVRLAISHHANVRYFDYLDTEGILRICDTFMETVAAKIRTEKLYGRA